MNDLDNIIRRKCKYYIISAKIKFYGVVYFNQASRQNVKNDVAVNVLTNTGSLGNIIYAFPRALFISKIIISFIAIYLVNCNK